MCAKFSQSFKKQAVKKALMRENRVGVKPLSMKYQLVILHCKNGLYKDKNIQINNKYLQRINIKPCGFTDDL